MFRVNFLLYLLILPLFALGQKDSTPIGKVTYLHQTNLVGTNELNGDAILFFSKNKSIYIHQAAPKEGYIKEEGVLIDMIAGDEQGFPIFKDLKKKKVVYKTTFGLAKKKCIVKDTLPKIDWEIQNQSKKLGKYQCQKAVGKFGGRTYDVWFTTEIPISSGPHKLTGLPGLILEATSQDGRVQFLFKELELSTKFNYQIIAPTEKIKYNSKEDYDLALIEYNQNLLKRAQSKGINLQINTPHPESKIEKEY